ncbi:MAG: pectinesterase family protein [Ignavibacteriaceae bacterium]
MAFHFSVNPSQGITLTYNMNKKAYPIFILIIIFCFNVFPQYKHFITVAKNGSGDFQTITAAIESLPMFNYERVVIYVKNGTYNEKFRITQDYITIKGESRDSSIIEYSQLRTDWIVDKDSIGPAVINIYADDIILENLTIKNTQPLIGPHAFAIYGDGTRTIILNCNVLSKGGDTVSLWNYKTGMYYHADCTFSGSVDYVCPRGWCFIKNSKFYELRKTASIWHAGGNDINEKFVLRNCSFDGVNGFQLGRHHYEAQFYLLNCQFSKHMADTQIYRVSYPDQPEKDRPFNWGKRYYYYNCHRDSCDYNWFKNNLETAKNSPAPSDITPAWTFDNKWDPESIESPKIIKHEIHEGYILLFYNDQLTVIGKPILKSKSGIEFKYDSGAGSDTICFNFKGACSESDLIGLRLINSSKIYGNTASVKERDAVFDL